MGGQSVTRERIHDIMRLLRYEIKEHSDRYYIDCEPVISDEEYDELMRLLEKFEAMYPQFITPDSPTQRVGSDVEG